MYSYTYYYSKTLIYVTNMITNIVCMVNLKVQFNLKALCYKLCNAIYNPFKFSSIIWKHKKLKGTCLVFSNGKLIMNGFKSKQEMRKNGRKFIRILQKKSCLKLLNFNFKIITMSASYRLSGRIDLYLFSNYEPEICNSVMLKREDVTFLIFASGTIIVTGIKSMKCIDTIVYPVIMELELKI